MSLPEPPLLEVAHLSKVFRGPGGAVTAVDDVAFVVRRGRSLAIVGESGSGKTTVARMLVGLETPTQGTIRFAGTDRSTPSKSTRERAIRAREVQIVFQDPHGSLDPRQRVGSALEEIVQLHRPRSETELAGAADPGLRVRELLEQVGLGETEAAALPHQLSGGQRQRVAIARALAARPGVIVLDEPVSALDVSIQAQILRLLDAVRRDTGMSYVVISHDLAVVRQLAEEILVMYRGYVVERGPAAAILETPQHPYTKLLIDSVPRPGWQSTRRVVSPPLEGCVFRNRCPFAHDRCDVQPPPILVGSVEARCWLAMDSEDTPSKGDL
jgi:oligopeptide/dipeptide ABC transporter ATP-binding protein